MSLNTAWSVVAGTYLREHCVQPVACALSAGWRVAGSPRGAERVQARATHPDERITAARVDGDADRVLELGDAAGTVEEATGAAAGERGGRPGGDVDTADAVVMLVLRCIMKGHTLRKS